MSRNRRSRGAPHPEFASRIDVRAADRPGHGEGPADEGEPGRPAVEAREKAQDGSKVIMGARRGPRSAYYFSPLLRSLRAPQLVE